MRLPSLDTMRRILSIAIKVKDAVQEARQKPVPRPHSVDRALRDTYTSGEYQGGYAPKDAPRIPDDGKL